MITLHRDNWHSNEKGEDIYFFKCGNHASHLFPAQTKNDFIDQLNIFLSDLKMSPYELTGDMILSEQTKHYINTADAASTLGRKGGSSTSEAKRRASAENGKKGGRPKKS